MKRKLSILVSCFFLISSCSSLNKASWLLDTWESQTSRGSVYEVWTKEGKQELVAKSYKLNGTDTILLETVQIVKENGQLYYIPTVSTQNEGKPVRFSLVEMTKTTFTFENPEHDFPQTISYRKIGKDSLIAEIAGTRKGKESRRRFPMRRVSPN